MSPDAAYVLPENLGPREGRGRRMAHHCPDFVIELLSGSDRLAKAQAKMQDWIANGAQLGWLVDPYRQQVMVYAPGKSAEVVTGNSVAGKRTRGRIRSKPRHYLAFLRDVAMAQKGEWPFSSRQATQASTSLSFAIAVIQIMACLQPKRP